MRTADTDFPCPFLILQNITMMERNVSHMKVLLINGSPHEKGCTYTALHEMEKVFRESGVETELVSVGTNPIRGCIACGGCRKKGACVFSDLVNEIAPKFEACDGLVVGSPVYYASANATLVALLDRLFYSTPFDKTMKVGAAVASARRGGLTATFDELNKYFTISSMPVVSSQYWNGVHGDRPEEVRADLEGMQTLRLVGDNMAWLLRSMTAAREAGVVPYEREVRVKTNFYKPEAAPNVQGEG